MFKYTYFPYNIWTFRVHFHSLLCSLLSLYHQMLGSAEMFLITAQYPMLWDRNTTTIRYNPKSNGSSRGKFEWRGEADWPFPHSLLGWHLPPRRQPSFHSGKEILLPAWKWRDSLQPEHPSAWQDYDIPSHPHCHRVVQFFLKKTTNTRMNFKMENSLEALCLSENNTRNFTHRHIPQQQKKWKNNRRCIFVYVCIMQTFLK